MEISKTLIGLVASFPFLYWLVYSLADLRDIQHQYRHAVDNEQVEDDFNELSNDNNDARGKRKNEEKAVKIDRIPYFVGLLDNISEKITTKLYTDFEYKAEQINRVPYPVNLLDSTSDKFYINYEDKSEKNKSSDSKYSRQMLTWYKAYKSGKYKSNNEIAVKVFGKAMPHEKLKFKHSYPFLTQDTLRAWTDWSIVTIKMKITPGLANNEGRPMKDGDSIFVKSDFIHKFAKNVDPRLKISYILVTGYSALSVPRNRHGNSMFLLKSPRLIRWFAKNPNQLHPKLEALALGLPNFPEGPTGHPKILAASVYPEVPFFQPEVKGSNESNPRPGSSDHPVSKVTNPRPYRSYINFNYKRKHTSPQRKVAIRLLRKISFVRKKVSPQRYLKDLKKTRFVISPPGVGWDCFRTWEAVLFGAIPIVLNSAPMSDLYRRSPVMVVNRWSQVTKKKLDNFQVGTTSKDVVFADYWLDRIEDARTKWFQKYKNTTN